MNRHTRIERVAQDEHMGCGVAAKPESRVLYWEEHKPRKK